MKLAFATVTVNDLLSELLLPGAILSQGLTQRMQPGAKVGFRTFVVMLAMLSIGAVAYAEGKKPKPVPVRVEPVKVVDFHDRIEAIGTLRAKDSVAVTATVTDIVSAIHFDDGQRVEKGQILVEMVAAEERALLSEIESIVAESKSQYERTKGLAKRKLTAETVLDERRRLYQTSKARLLAMNARMADRTIRAPFSGVVGLRNISVGALVEPGTLIVDIADDSTMKLDFSVPSTFIEALVPGLPIEAQTRGLGAQKFYGKVTGIDNRIDQATRTIRVRALLPNEDRRLVPGLLMQIVLVKNQRRAKVIPEEAIVPVARESFVFVVDEATSTAKRRSIKVGQRRPGEIEVLDGLEAGELVVTHGALKLRPGAPVVINNEKYKRITPPPEGAAVERSPPSAAPVVTAKPGGAGRS